MACIPYMRVVDFLVLNKEAGGQQGSSRNEEMQRIHKIGWKVETRKTEDDLRERRGLRESCSLKVRKCAQGSDSSSGIISTSRQDGERRSPKPRSSWIQGLASVYLSDGILSDVGISAVHFFEVYYRTVINHRINDNNANKRRELTYFSRGSSRHAFFLSIEICLHINRLSAVDLTPAPPPSSLLPPPPPLRDMPLSCLMETPLISRAGPSA